MCVDKLVHLLHHYTTRHDLKQYTYGLRNNIVPQQLYWVRHTVQIVGGKWVTPPEVYCSKWRRVYLFIPSFLTYNERLSQQFPTDQLRGIHQVQPLHHHTPGANHHIIAFQCQRHIRFQSGLQVRSWIQPITNTTDLLDDFDVDKTSLRCADGFPSREEPAFSPDVRCWNQI